MSRYLFRQCITPGCSVMIGWAIGSLQGLADCKWCQQGKAYYLVIEQKKA